MSGCDEEEIIRKVGLCGKLLELLKCFNLGVVFTGRIAMKLVEICRERAGGGKNIIFLGNL